MTKRTCYCRVVPCGVVGEDFYGVYRVLKCAECRRRAHDAKEGLALRERVKALVADLEKPYESGFNNTATPRGMARRIRRDVLLEVVA